MKLTIMGTSCSWFARRNTSFVIDDNIMLDTPAGSYKYVVANGDITKIDTIFITHFHDDHFIDLRLFTTSFMRNYRGSRIGKLKVYGPKGIAQKIIDLNKFIIASEDECSMETTLKSVEFIEVEEGKVYKVGKYEVEAFKMEHGKPETYGYKFKEVGGKAVAFSADTIYCDNVQKIVSGADVAFVDCTTLKPHKSHMHINDLLKIIKDNPKTKVYPVHTCDDTQKFIEDNNLNPLYDGQVINI